MGVVMNGRLAVILLSGAVVVGGCLARKPDTAPISTSSFDTQKIFPADRSLARPEDGVALPDGRVVVGDQITGLRLLSSDGTSRSFGRFVQAGYLHRPPEVVGAPNGVTLEPTGTHILVSDVYRGGIYRVEIATEATERIYQHPFGVNTARRDRVGGIWFTQSTRNRPEHGEQELFRSVGLPTPDGALFYLPPSKGGQPPAPVLLVDRLLFANGVALDETAGHLFVAETTGNRVLRYRMDTAAGRVTDRTVLLDVSHPDNLELDRQQRLWIASPVRSEIVVYDLGSRTSRSVFRISTAKSEQRIEAIEARIRNGESWVDLIAPELWEPGPGLITGIILPAAEGPVYLSGLGNALIRLPP